MKTRKAMFAAVALVTLTAADGWADQKEEAPPVELGEEVQPVEEEAAEEEVEEAEPEPAAQPAPPPKKEPEPAPEASPEPQPEAPWYRAPAYGCKGCIDGRPPPPRRIAYHESMDVPDGYHLETTPRYGLIGAGIAITGTLWAVSMISAIALDKEATQDGDPNFDDMYWPMFIPVVGPFAAIGTADSSGTGAAILALDGAIQAAGLAMVIGGFVAPTVEIVEDYKINITPVASKENSGVNLSGSF